MDQEQNRELLRQIDAFELSDPQADVEFETKLADEQGWTRGYAAAVTREYRRFLYLTQVAGHMVCPSDEVDQAWHLHLTQTVSYQRLAQLLPGGFLHHHPSKGGPDELAKHKAMYQRTLQAYEAHLGSAAPPEFWPSVAQRFVVRRPTPLASPGVASLLGRRADNAAPVLLAGMVFAGLLLNLLPMQEVWRAISGMAFVGFFVVMLIAASGVASDDEADATCKRQGLWADPYEVAYLEGGLHRMLGTAMARLVDLGWIDLSAQREAEKIKGVACRKVGEPDVHRRAQLHPFERHIIDALPMGDFEPKALESVALPYANAVRMRLAASGLVLPFGHILRARLAAACILAVVGALGINRLVHGIEGAHPVLFLAVLLTINVLAIQRYCNGSRIEWQRTPSGTRALQELKQRHASLKEVPQRLDGELPQASWCQGLGAKLALGFALFGTQAVMANQAFAGVNFVFGANDPNNTGNSNSVAGCGGGGCGGGCGGCGGCGG